MKTKITYHWDGAYDKRTEIRFIPTHVGQILEKTLKSLGFDQLNPV